MTTNDRLPNVHPGEIIREEYLVPLGLTPYRLAKDLGVPYTRVEAILKGRRAITADTALRLARYFGNSPRFWLNLQAHFDLEEARTPEFIAELERLTPHPMPHLHEERAAA